MFPSPRAFHPILLAGALVLASRGAAAAPPDSGARTAPPVSDAAVAPAAPPARSDSAQDDAAYRSAVQWIRRGRPSPALLESLRGIAARGPTVARYQAAYGAALIDEALSLAADALPDALPAHRSRAQRGDPAQLFERGAEQIAAAVRLEPLTDEWPELLGWAHLANARIGITPDADASRARARDLLREAIRLNPRERTYWQSIGDLDRLSPGRATAPPTTPGSEEARSGRPPESAHSLSRVPAAPGPAKTIPAHPDAEEFDAYRRALTGYPRNAAMQFLMYQLDERRHDDAGALSALQLAARFDRSNAAPFYLLADIDFARSGASPDDPAAEAWETAGFQALGEAEAAPGFNLEPYQPAYPALLAPALKTALGDSLTPDTLELYDRLKSLASRLDAAGAAWNAAGDPATAESLYQSAMAIGQRLVGSAAATSGRYLLHLPELSAGLTIRESGLASLGALYEEYDVAGRQAWLQSERIALDEIRQAVAQGARQATPDAEPDAGSIEGGRADGR